VKFRLIIGVSILKKMMTHIDQLLKEAMAANPDLLVDQAGGIVILLVITLYNYLKLKVIL